MKREILCRDAIREQIAFDLGDSRELRLDYRFDNCQHMRLFVDVLANEQLLSRLFALSAFAYVYYDALVISFSNPLRVGNAPRIGDDWTVFFPGPAAVTCYEGSTADRLANWLNAKVGVEVRTVLQHLRRLTSEERERFYRGTRFSKRKSTWIPEAKS